MPRFCNSAEKRRLMKALEGMKSIDFVTSTSVPRGEVHVIMNEKVYQQVFQDKGTVDSGKESVSHSAQPPATLPELAKTVSARLTEVVKHLKPSRFGDSGKKPNYIVDKTEEIHKDLQKLAGGFKSFDDPIQNLNFLQDTYLKLSKINKKSKEVVEEMKKQNAAKNTDLPASNDKEEEAGKANARGGKDQN